MIDTPTHAQCERVKCNCRRPLSITHTHTHIYADRLWIPYTVEEAIKDIVDILLLNIIVVVDAVLYSRDDDEVGIRINKTAAVGIYTHNNRRRRFVAVVTPAAAAAAAAAASRPIPPGPNIRTADYSGGNELSFSERRIYCPG